MTDKHAVYANCVSSTGHSLTFRVGLPIDWSSAQERWYRLDDLRRGMNGQTARSIRIWWNRHRYTVESFEVRSVDYNGRGLGSERHERAFPVPYRLLRKGKR
jgi:hypothetical protein